MLAGRWIIDGYAPPLFDEDARAAIEAPGEQKVKALLAEHDRLAASAERARLVQELAALDAAHAQTIAALRERHAANRHDRKQRRALHGDAHAIDQESRRDKAERRHTDDAYAAARARLLEALRPMERRLRALERLRRIVCAELMRRIHATYAVANGRGEVRSLRALFAPSEPPSGAGDCAAPKLLAHAFARGLAPLSLAEFYWGASGPRTPGAFYDPCPAKCGPILAFMAPATPQSFTVVYEDDDVLVVDKAAGLLSVPGKREDDSVLTRIRAAHPHAMLAHRLDLDTSGLLVAAKDGAAYRALQRQFAERSVEKRYVAVLSGRVQADHGRVDLALRVDVADRPRQLHDPLHGKRAVTDWRVIDRKSDRTRVAFTPLTGRTHQLRVHAAHPLGLDAPIVGDRLYGAPAERLLLHAEALAFSHPRTGARVRVESPAPF
jgi:tRNA pseudouridine32 synthase/23S rRNA pseudouridine746 synthase